MNIGELNITDTAVAFLLVLMRVSIIIALLPFLGSGQVPARFKIGLSVALAVIVTPLVSSHVDSGSIVIYVMREMLFSLTIALAIRFVFFAIDTAGQMISHAMGIAIAQVFNPELGQSTEIARIYGIVAMLVFLAMDAHHYFIYAIVKSYEILSPVTMNAGAMMKEAVSLSSRIFQLALKMAAPVIAVMMITHVALGFIAKLVPQFNVFFVGYPVYIGAGLMVILLGLPLFVYVMGNEFASMRYTLDSLISAAAGR